MFQSFETQSHDQGAARLARLRDAMATAGVQAFLVPLADAHQGEYVPASDARLAWLTGFTGSAGFAAVLADKAGVFIDGRYSVQARQQLDQAAFTPVDWPETELHTWLIAHLARGDVAYDPWLHTADQIDKLREKLPQTITLRPHDNLVDQIWEDQPEPPTAPMRIQPDALAGKSHDQKRAELADGLRSSDMAAAVMTLTDSTSWLLNLRGADIPRNPIVRAFSILHEDGRVALFTDAQISAEVRAHLGDAVHVHPHSALLDVASEIEGRVLIDTASAPAALRDALQQPQMGQDPCALPKACKTEAEIEGCRAAHLRDAVAMVRFLHWLSNADGLTEISAATQLEEFRRAGGQLVDISFDTISGSGPNAALPHYRVTTQSDRALQQGELYLVDSGGQYQDGTTDITRTIAIGTPQPHHRAWYTRVLQGMIAIHRIRFPKGTTGSQLDVLARAALWQAGVDYDHGTGHGVGSHLCVHEGPQRISKAPNTIALAPGMILSNEPGCYVEGDFGIRIENLIVVREAAALPEQDARPWLDFENVTFVPLDRALIATEMLSPAERAWIDAYHAQILEKLSPRLDGAVLEWLRAACAAL